MHPMLVSQDARDVATVNIAVRGQLRYSGLIYRYCQAEPGPETLHISQLFAVPIIQLDYTLQGQGV